MQCHNCSGFGHYANVCPSAKGAAKASQTETTHVQPSPQTKSGTPSTTNVNPTSAYVLTSNNTWLELRVLCDTGSYNSLINASTARKIVGPRATQTTHARSPCLHASETSSWTLADGSSVTSNVILRADVRLVCDGREQPINVPLHVLDGLVSDLILGRDHMIEAMGFGGTSRDKRHEESLNAILHSLLWGTHNRVVPYSLLQEMVTTWEQTSSLRSVADVARHYITFVDDCSPALHLPAHVRGLKLQGPEGSTFLAAVLTGDNLGNDPRRRLIPCDDPPVSPPSHARAASTLSLETAGHLDASAAAEEVAFAHVLEPGIDVAKTVEQERSAVDTQLAAKLADLKERMLHKPDVYALAEEILLRHKERCLRVRLRPTDDAAKVTPMPIRPRIPGMTYSSRQPHYSPVKQLAAESLLQHLANVGVMTRNDLATCALPVLLVSKAPLPRATYTELESITDWNEFFRVVADTKPLNAVTQPLAYDFLPWQRSFELVATHGNPSWFIVVDLVQAFYQFPEDDPEHLQNVKIHNAVYQVNRVLQGHRNSTAYLNATMRTVLKGLIDHVNVTCHDDILVVGDSEIACLNNFDALLERLSAHNLRVSVKKLQLLHSSVTFGGASLSPDGVKPDANKVHAILEWPRPSNAHSLQQFLGLVRWIGEHIVALQHSLGVLDEMLSSVISDATGSEKQNPADRTKTKTLKKSPCRIQFGCHLALPHLTMSNGRPRVPSPSHLGITTNVAYSSPTQARLVGVMPSANALASRVTCRLRT